MKLSEKIIDLRKQQGWSQEELAERLNVSRQSVSKWESGMSTPELERIIQLCDLFGLDADSLIRDDLPLAAECADEARDVDVDRPILTQEDVYAYLSQCQSFAHEIGLGVGACVLSPAPLIALTDVFGRSFGAAIGVPMLLIIVAWAVYRFIMAGSEMQRYRYIDKGCFLPARGVLSWARDSRDQFRSTFIREISLGTVLCIVSPGPLIFLDVFFRGSRLVIGMGVGLLLALAAAGCYLFVRSGCIQGCYHRLLKDR